MMVQSRESTGVADVGPQVQTWRTGLREEPATRSAGAASMPTALSCSPCGIRRKRKVGIAKSASLSLKQAVKVCPIVLHKVFDFIFYGKPREKAHRDPFECLTVVAHFLFVSTCVTKSSDPTSLGTRLPMCHLFQEPNYALR